MPCPERLRRRAALSRSRWSRLGNRYANWALALWKRQEAKLAGTGIASSFAGVSELLGGGIVLAFLGHFVDETRKGVLELGHLSAQTGITIEALSGLQTKTREIGVEFSAVESGIVRLERAQALAVEGHKAQQEAFERLGISMEQVKSANPSELFNLVSGALQKTSSSADAAASAIGLLGRGGAALIPLFKEYGDTIAEQSAKQGQATGVTKEAKKSS